MMDPLPALRSDLAKSQHHRPARRAAARLVLTCAVWGALACGSGTAPAQDGAIGARSSNLVVADDVDLSVHTPDGFVMQGRAGLWGFRTFGRDDSIMTLELFPSVLDDNLMLFGDARLFSTFQGQFGGNIGAGGRFRTSRVGRIYGGSLWYDIDDSLESFFQQVGLSFETYGDVFDARTNVYIPVGQSEDLIRNHLINPHFVDNALLFDRVSTYGKALPGVDYEIGMLLPTPVLRQHNLRWFVGGYHFGANNVDPVHGFKSRLEGTLIPSLDTQAEFTTDRLFGTNVMLAVTWTYFGDFKRKETTAGLKYDRMSEFVRRNFNVIVDESREITPDVVAMNAQTGQAFVVQHVGAGGNSSGTPEDPWGSIADAQAAGGDIIIVHSGTVLTEGIVLQSGQQIFGLGDGLANFVDVAGYGRTALPVETGARPVIEGAAGNAVTLASNSIFSGFVIHDPTGHGIVGTNVDNVAVWNVDILGAGLDGLYLNNPGGTADLRDIEIEDALGAGLHISGGDALVRFGGGITTSAGRSLLIENTTDGLIDLTGATVLDDGGDGIRIANVDGDVTLSGVTVKNSSGIGIDVQGGDGIVAFLKTTTVNQAGGTGIRVADREGNTGFDKVEVVGSSGQRGVEVVDNTADTQFNTLNVNATNATAVLAHDSERLIILGGTVKSQGGTAVDVEDTRMAISLKEIFSDSATVGLRLVDAAGVFVLSGGSSYASGGMISHAGTGVLLDNAGTVSLRYLDLDENATGIKADTVAHLALNGLRVTDSAGIGLDGRNVKQLYTFNSLFSGSGGAAMRLRADAMGEYVYSITQTTLSSQTGDGLVIFTEAGGKDAALNLLLQSTVVSSGAIGGAAVNVDWDGILLANLIANQIEATGDNGAAVDIDALSTTKLVQVTVGNNNIGVKGNHGKGVSILTAGASTVTLGGNQVTLDGSGSTGLDFTLAASADLAVLSNSITDNKGGATGILFNSVAGPSTVEIGGNLIDLKGPGALIDQGIIFQAITGTLTLQGSTNNEVRNATTPFFAPQGTTSGRIRVNGQNVP